MDEIQRITSLKDGAMLTRAKNYYGKPGSDVLLMGRLYLELLVKFRIEVTYGFAPYVFIMFSTRAADNRIDRSLQGRFQTIYFKIPLPTNRICVRFSFPSNQGQDELILKILDELLMLITLSLTHNITCLHKLK